MGREHSGRQELCLSISLPPILVSLTCPCPAEAALLCLALVSSWPGPASTLGLSCVPGLPKLSTSFSYHGFTWAVPSAFKALPWLLYLGDTLWLLEASLSSLRSAHGLGPNSEQSVSLGAQSDLPELGQLRPQMS